MALIDASTEGWRLNRINAGPPYHVEAIQYGPHYAKIRQSPPQVVDARGTVAITREGAVFCATWEQAESLCAAANAGELERI